MSSKYECQEESQSFTGQTHEFPSKLASERIARPERTEAGSATREETSNRNLQRFLPLADQVVD